METGLFGGHADKFYESLLSGGDAGDLPATSGAGGNSGRLATQASLAGSLFYSGGVGREGVRRRPYLSSGAALARARRVHTAGAEFAGPGKWIWQLSGE